MKRETPNFNPVPFLSTYLKRLLKQIAGTLETVMAETADTIISGYNGKKTIQKICEIITTRIKHVKTYL